MRTVKSAPDDLPPGYQLVRFDMTTALALPSALAGASRAEVQRREAAADNDRREALRLRQDELKDTAQTEQSDKAAQANAQARAHALACGDEAAPGQYREIRKWAELVDASEDTAQTLRSADKDVNERRSRLRQRLIQSGPDRRVAQPEGWREAVNGLQASLPHFREPIRLLHNALALAEASGRAVRVPPMLLLGPPGVGKTHFTHRVAELLGAPHASIAFDQPTAGSTLRGSDAHWSNTSTGLLFNLICMGEYANPVVLLDVALPLKNVLHS